MIILLSCNKYRLTNFIKLEFYLINFFLNVFVTSQVIVIQKYIYEVKLYLKVRKKGAKLPSTKIY